MAYGDEGSSFWQTDLSTRTGAEAAASQGGTACFVMVGMAVLGAIFGIFTANGNMVDGVGIAVAGGIEGIVALVAGLRLRSGKGAFWGIAALVLLVIECIGKLVSVSIGGAVVTGILSVVLFNGIRGAFALRRSGGFEEDVADVFK